MTPADLRAMTEPRCPELVPELRFSAPPGTASLEYFRSRWSAVTGSATPYWAVAWPGGQALARYILDNPQAVARRRVIDLGCGAGLVAAAALVVGADAALAVDCDPNALVAAGETARLNGVAIETQQAAFETFSTASGAVICAGDLWYERETGRRATTSLTRLGASASAILLGDADRPGRPRRGVREVARYALTVPGEFSRDGQTEAAVYTFSTTLF